MLAEVGGVYCIKKAGGLGEIPLLPIFEASQQPSHSRRHPTIDQIGIGGGHDGQVRELSKNWQEQAFDRWVIKPSIGKVAGGSLCLLPGEAAFAIEIGHDHCFHAGPCPAGFLHLAIIAQAGKDAACFFIVTGLQSAACLLIEIGDSGGGGGGISQRGGAGCGGGDFTASWHGFVRVLEVIPYSPAR